MKQTKVVFVPLKYHLRFLYEAFCTISVCHALVHKGLLQYGNETDSKMSQCEMHSFGLHTLGRLFSFETQMPIYISGFSEQIKKQSPRHIICFDFYHWYVLQSIRYIKSHPQCQIILYSETKRWPVNPVPKMMMYGFLLYLKRHTDKIEQVLVYTEEGRLWWEKQAPELKVEILGAPVDTEAFNAVQSKEWLPNDTLRILMNARYSAYKRHQDLFQAAVDLQKKGKKIQITLIGRADSGRERIERLVTEFGLQSIVTFLDPLPMDKMPALYHSHDVLALPSYNEAIGMVVPEAMACGLPTVTSDTVGANVYVNEGETGWVYPTGDVEALAAVLDECFDATELERRGAAARTRVAEHFSVPIIAQQLLELLDEQS